MKNEEYKNQPQKLPATSYQLQACPGFSLVEILVAITLFSVIMISGVGALISINDANRNTQAMRAAIDNVNFALDNMARRLRTGSNFHCMSLNESDYPQSEISGVAPDPKDCESGEKAIAFSAAEFLGSAISLSSSDTISQSGELSGGVIIYRLGAPNPANDNKRAIEVNTREQGGAFSNEYRPVTAPEVDIEDMSFVVIGAEDSQTQPFVLITLVGSVETGTRRVGDTIKKTTFRIQTTVSQRLLGS